MGQTPFIISETFPISVDNMFDLWANPAHLGKWFGPAGVTIIRQTVDLRVGGAHHFCLQMPGGQLMWGKWVFREITAPKRLAWIHAFSDEAGGLTRHPMSPTWPLELLSTVDFQQEGGGMTRITLQWIPHNANATEQDTFDKAHDSMRQGWGGTMKQLGAYVAGLQC